MVADILIVLGSLLVAAGLTGVVGRIWRWRAGRTAGPAGRVDTRA